MKAKREILVNVFMSVLLICLLSLTCTSYAAPPATAQKSTQQLKPATIPAAIVQDTFPRSREFNGVDYIVTPWLRSREITGVDYIGTPWARSREFSGVDYTGTPWARSREFTGVDYIGTPK